ncbi:hypothetical protein BDB01DRAFT_173927 [Pilobolus umbonatus]|nr:hypothetical protein BDB01DRAFT_173927 [Pilobolus umbonatus]
MSVSWCVYCPFFFFIDTSFLMPPRFPPNQGMNQKPLQNEIIILNRLLGNEILEHSTRVLDHFAVTSGSKLQTSLEPPSHLIHNLLEKCEDFETVCDQIYFILEQSKRVLQLEWQQKNAQAKAALLDKERQLHEKLAEQGDQMMADSDMSLGYPSHQMDISLSLDESTMMDPHNQHNHGNHPSNHHLGNTTIHEDSNMDEDDMEELLQIQRDRLDRLKNVIVLGMDAELVKASGENAEEEDLLF